MSAIVILSERGPQDAPLLRVLGWGVAAHLLAAELRPRGHGVETGVLGVRRFYARRGGEESLRE